MQAFYGRLWSKVWRRQGRFAMLVKDIMTPQAETIAIDDSLQAAAEKMRRLNVGALPVVVDERPVGMLTDRDIVVRGVARGLDPVHSSVREAMTPQLVWCFEDQDTYEAAQLMEQKAVRRLMVFDRDERLVGMLSVDDLAMEARQEKLAGEVIDSAAAMRPPSG
jgi:CBS domain-containing protein